MNLKITNSNNFKSCILENLNIQLTFNNTKQTSNIKNTLLFHQKKREIMKEEKNLLLLQARKRANIICFYIMCNLPKAIQPYLLFSC